MVKRYTLEDLKDMDCMTITPAVAADVLHCNPQGIRICARESPQRLNFPVIVLGSRVLIPRIPFIQAMEGRTQK